MPRDVVYRETISTQLKGCLPLLFRVRPVQDPWPRLAQSAVTGFMQSIDWLAFAPCLDSVTCPQHGRMIVAAEITPDLRHRPSEQTADSAHRLLSRGYDGISFPLAEY